MVLPPTAGVVNRLTPMVPIPSERAGASGGGRLPSRRVVFSAPIDDDDDDDEFDSEMQEPLDDDADEEPEGESDDNDADGGGLAAAAGSATGAAPDGGIRGLPVPFRSSRGVSAAADANGGAGVAAGAPMQAFGDGVAATVRASANAPRLQTMRAALFEEPPIGVGSGTPGGLDGRQSWGGTPRRWGGGWGAARRPRSLFSPGGGAAARDVPTSVESRERGRGGEIGGRASSGRFSAAAAFGADGSPSGKAGGLDNLGGEEEEEVDEPSEELEEEEEEDEWNEGDEYGALASGVPRSWLSRTRRSSLASLAAHSFLPPAPSAAAAVAAEDSVVPGGVGLGRSFRISFGGGGLVAWPACVQPPRSGSEADAVGSVTTRSVGTVVLSQLDLGGGGVARLDGPFTRHFRTWLPTAVGAGPGRGGNGGSDDGHEALDDGKASVGVAGPRRPSLYTAFGDPSTVEAVLRGLVRDADAGPDRHAALFFRLLHALYGVESEGDGQGGGRGGSAVHDSDSDDDDNDAASSVGPDGGGVADAASDGDDASAGGRSDGGVDDAVSTDADDLPGGNLLQRLSGWYVRHAATFFDPPSSAGAGAVGDGADEDDDADDDRMSDVGAAASVPAARSGHGGGTVARRPRLPCCPPTAPPSAYAASPLYPVLTALAAGRVTAAADAALAVGAPRLALLIARATEAPKRRLRADVAAHMRTLRALREHGRTGGVWGGPAAAAVDADGNGGGGGGGDLEAGPPPGFSSPLWAAAERDLLVEAAALRLVAGDTAPAAAVLGAAAPGWYTRWGLQLLYGAAAAGSASLPGAVAAAVAAYHAFDAAVCPPLPPYRVLGGAMPLLEGEALGADHLRLILGTDDGGLGGGGGADGVGMALVGGGGVSPINDADADTDDDADAAASAALVQSALGGPSSGAAADATADAEPVDAVWHLLRLYAAPAGAYTVARGLYEPTAGGCGRRPADAAVGWTAHEVLRALLGGGVGGLPRAAAADLADATAAQADAAGSPVWAIYVLAAAGVATDGLAATVERLWPRLVTDATVLRCGLLDGLPPPVGGGSDGADGNGDGDNDGAALVGTVDWGGVPTLGATEGTSSSDGGGSGAAGTGGPTEDPAMVTGSVAAFLTRALRIPSSVVAAAAASWSLYGGRPLDGARWLVTAATPAADVTAHRLLVDELFPALVGRVVPGSPLPPPLATVGDLLGVLRDRLDSPDGEGAATPPSTNATVAAAAAADRRALAAAWPGGGGTVLGYLRLASAGTVMLSSSEDPPPPGMSADATYPGSTTASVPVEALVAAPPRSAAEWTARAAALSLLADGAVAYAGRGAAIAAAGGFGPAAAADRHALAAAAIAGAVVSAQRALVALAATSPVPMVGDVPASGVAAVDRRTIESAMSDIVRDLERLPAAASLKVRLAREYEEQRGGGGAEARRYALALRGGGGEA
ncbi:hypothetical protein MMPV_001168 [Pyropia vietnamensis]